MDWDLEIKFISIFHFYYCKREHSTTGQIPKYVLDNFSNEKVSEK